MQHSGPIAGIAAQGNLIATAGYDNRLILWDGRQRQALACSRHDHLVNQCSFSRDGRWLVSASSDYSARVWQLPSLRLHAVLGGHEDDVDMAVFSPDDSLIATCALDRCVRIFNRDGLCLHVMHGHTGNVLSLAWMRDGQRLVSSSVDGTIRLWDAKSGEQLQCTDLAIRSDSVEIDANGVIFAGDDLGRIAMIDDGSLHFVAAHQAGIKKLVLDERQGVLVTLSYDRSLAVWRYTGAKQLLLQARTTLPAPVWARAATVLADGRVATGTFGGSYALYDPQTDSWDMQDVQAGPGINALLHQAGHLYSVGDAGEVRRDGQLLAGMGSLCNFLVAAGTQILTGGQLGQLFDAQTGQLLYQHHSPLNCAVTFCKDMAWHCAVGSYTGEILVFALQAEGKWQRVQQLQVYQNAIKGLAYSEGVLFSVCASTAVSWHAVNDWSLQQQVAHGHQRIANDCCAIGPGVFASISRDRKLRLWHGDTVECFDSPHPNSIKCLAINQAGNTLLTGSYGGTLALFDLQQKCWQPMQRPTIAGISDITWLADQHCFVAASYDGQLHRIEA